MQALAAEPAQLADVPANVLKSKSVLIVDDLSVNRIIMSKYVEQWGGLPHRYSDASSALAAVRSRQVFDLAIIDM